MASRAATRMSKEDLARLQDNLTEYLAAIKAGDHPRVAKIGHQFHRIINLAAGSPRLALLLGSLAKQLPNRFYTEIEGQVKDAAEYHPVILEAIRLRDAKSAGSLMSRHINSGGEHLVEMLRRNGVWTGASDTGARATTSDSTAGAKSKLKAKAKTKNPAKSRVQAKP